MIADRRVKIVATIGPSTWSKENLKKLIFSGTNVFRLNFSHGTHEDHLKVISETRALSKELKAPVTLIQDLQGPKIRVGKLKGGQMELKDGQKVIVRATKEEGEGNLIPSDYPSISKSAIPGEKILMDDGLLELQIDEIKDEDVLCTVIYGGILKNRKGMNLPGAHLDVDCLTSKDLEDLDLGLKVGVDYVALSFVRRGSDIRRLREIVESKNPMVRIIAKIEMLEALDNLSEICELSDAVMVARGDLAVEVGQSLLAATQKEIIRVCNLLSKPVITATQMLDSMVENPRPTRAEVTDIANAVLDGSDALMLSAETASGKYPFKCVATMAEVISAAEATAGYYYRMTLDNEFMSVAEAIAASACLCALKLNATAIVCLTTSGKTARLISAFRPKARIIAVTHKVETLNRMELIWGIQTLVIDPYESTDAAMEIIEKTIVNYGLAKRGDKVVLTMGMPVLKRGTTNSLRVHTVQADPPEISPEKLPLRCLTESELLNS